MRNLLCLSLLSTIKYVNWIPIIKNNLLLFFLCRPTDYFHRKIELISRAFCHLKGYVENIPQIGPH